MRSEFAHPGQHGFACVSHPVTKGYLLILAHIKRKEALTDQMVEPLHRPSVVRRRVPPLLLGFEVRDPEVTFDQRELYLSNRSKPTLNHEAEENATSGTTNLAPLPTRLRAARRV